MGACCSTSASLPAPAPGGRPPSDSLATPLASSLPAAARASPAPSAAPAPEREAVLRFTVELWRASAVEALETMLAAPPAIRHWLDDFMTSECNTNHLTFYDEVEALKRDDTDGALAWSRAQAIYNRYVRRGGEEEVNLPASFRAARFDSTAHVQLLTQAQHEVLVMMALDAFPRFLRSRFCDRMLEELARAPAAEWPALVKQPVAAAHAQSTPGSSRGDGTGVGGSGVYPHPAGARAVFHASADGAEAGSGIISSAASPPSPTSRGGGSDADHSEATTNSLAYTSVDLASSLRAARLNLAQGKGRWLEVFKGVADVLPVCIVIADMRQPGVPIVYANAAFYMTTGYRASEVLGRNCRFLQGPGTDLATVERLRDALRNGREIHCEILNYRRDGTPFRNFLSMTPVWDRAPHGTAVSSAAATAAGSAVVPTSNFSDHAVSAALSAHSTAIVASGGGGSSSPIRTSEAWGTAVPAPLPPSTGTDSDTAFGKPSSQVSGRMAGLGTTSMSAGPDFTAPSGGTASVAAPAGPSSGSPALPGAVLAGDSGGESGSSVVGAAVRYRAGGPTVLSGIAEVDGESAATRGSAGDERSSRSAAGRVHDTTLVAMVARGSTTGGAIIDPSVMDDVGHAAAPAAPQPIVSARELLLASSERAGATAVAAPVAGAAAATATSSKEGAMAGGAGMVIAASNVSVLTAPMTTAVVARGSDDRSRSRPAEFSGMSSVPAAERSVATGASTAIPGPGAGSGGARLAYFIGVQFEVTDDSLIATKLLRHDALMHILPKYVAM